MNKQVQQEIEARIDEASSDTIFLTNDFKDIAPIVNIRKVLSRLVESNKLIRLMDGMYYKSDNIELPSVERIAKEIAREYRWTIAPSSKRCLFLLGLSDKDDDEHSFISDGPSRTYQYSETTISFITRRRKYVTNLSYITIIFIEALRTLTKDNVDNKVILILKNKLTNEDKQTLLKEAKGINDWIYAIIKKICSE